MHCVVYLHVASLDWGNVLWSLYFKQESKDKWVSMVVEI